MPIYYQLTSITLPISLESIGNHWEQEIIRREQGYPYYHWLQTESGKGEIWIGKERRILNAGEGILLNPFVPHAYYPIANWKTKFATFEGTLSEQLALIFGTESYLPAADTANFSYSQWVDEIIKKHETGQLEATALSIDCYRFLLQISQQKRQTGEQHQLRERYVQPIIKEIETHYSENLTTKALAEKIFVSPQYLTRLFQRFTDKSTYQYLTDLRLNKAKELLVNHPSLDIQEVALRVGFQSPSQFIAMFRKKVGCTPKAFQQLLHK